MAFFIFSPHILDAQMDHSEEDCVVVIMLSHGDFKDPSWSKPGFDEHTILNHNQLSFICSKDMYYRLQTIFQYFTNENCPTLKDKPRIFFIQACQGNRLDSGIDLVDMDRNAIDDSYDSVSSIDNDELKHIHPVLPQKDFLVAYSTSPKHYSFRSPETGTWFIKELCKELDESWKDRDLLNMLTCVARKVAIDCESKSKIVLYDKRKQIPCISSMLTKLVFFQKTAENIVE